MARVGTEEITNSADIIDSRDVIARIDELQAKEDALAEAQEELDKAKEALEESKKRDVGDNQEEDLEDEDDDTEELPEAEDLDDAQKAFDDADSDFDEDERKELKALKALQEEAEGYAPDWNHGATLISRSHFVDYCQELVKDIGDMPKELPDYIANNIDWKGVADDLEADYTTVDFDGQEYLVR